MASCDPAAASAPRPALLLEACLGGVLIGAAMGTYMLGAKKIAGNSGALKACVLAGSKSSDVPNIMFVLGLVVVGVVTGNATPWSYEVAPTVPKDWPYYVFGGFSTGVGVTLQNGCTSGHGLAGLSRLSLRSLTAVPIFMFVAAFTATAKFGFAHGPIAPFESEPASHLHAAAAFFGASALLLVPLLLARCCISQSSARWSDSHFVQLHKSYTGFVTGSIFGMGLALGGMVRPSTVLYALSPKRFDLTLWVLFCTALAVTFCLYRIAQCLGIEEARHKNKRGQINRHLLIGAILFGFGWGITGLCPGPLVVAAAAEPFTGQGYSGGPMLTLFFVILGIRAASLYLGRIPNSTSSTATATVDAEARLIGKDAVAPANFNISIGSPHTCANDAEVQAVLAGRRGGDIPLILDVRQADGRDANDRGVYTACHGALSIPWQKDQLVIKSPLLTDSAIAERVARGEKIIIFCRSGKRACKAADFLLSRQAQHGSKESKHEKNIATCFICCGLHQLAAALPPSALHSHDAYFCGESGQPVFKQLFDGPDDGPFGSRTGQSSTYTYILGCPTTKEAVIIDPVVERIDRDVGELKAMGLTPVLALNTHCHADHVTGTGQLKKLFPGLKTMISAASGARADGHLEPGGTVEWGHGRRLQVLATPGHTSGCVSFYCADMGAVFTGDALLIGGCGRTDFQEGSADVLYDSVHGQIFTLPPSTLVYPGHDYRGRVKSSVKTEKESNPRLCKTKAEFMDIMENLNLAYPKHIDRALPANMKCGIFDE